MDTKNNNLNNEPQEITYQVMPKPDGHYVPAPESAPAPRTPQAPAPKPTPMSPPLPPTPPSNQVLATPLAPHNSGSFWRNHWLYIILGFVVLATVGYFIYSLTMGGAKNEPTEESQETTTRLPKVWLKQYFNMEVCDDESVCGDAADPDSDGLANYDEFKEGTSPINSDTDSDGLADGDEVHVYKTETTLKYTDRRDVVSTNNWTDGIQIQNGYDPLTPGLKFTESRLAQIAEDIKTHPLNEPTITTLQIGTEQESTDTSSDEAAANSAVVIEGDKFVPAEIKVKVGDTVVWLNKDSVAHTVSSDPHPNHTALPEFASQSIGANQTYSFTFTKAGTWSYHDHFNPTIKGKVIVE